VSTSTTTFATSQAHSTAATSKHIEIELIATYNNEARLAVQQEYTAKE
jgi:hypothetical protein